MTWTKALLSMLIIGTLLGCSAREQHPIPDLSYVEDYNPHPDPGPSQTGSLWDSSRNTSIYFLDKKARRLNDILTVRVVESSSASNSGSTSTSKSSSYDMGVGTFLGQEDGWMGAADAVGKVTGAALNPSIQASTENSFNGQGNKQKSDSINATVSARVVKVLNNGNLVVRGKRELVVDAEKQTIYVSGIVRPEDIDAQNTVLSSALADAQIMYSGSGSIANSQRKGWAVKFAEAIWPF